MAGARAQARYVRVTPQKARRVVDLIRGRRAEEATAVLAFAPQAVSETVGKVLASAVANARVKADRASEPFDEREMVVAEAYVDEGPSMKRFRPRAQGRAGRILKRTSHITVVVAPAPPRGPSGRGGSQDTRGTEQAAPRAARAGATSRKV